MFKFVLLVCLALTCSYANKVDNTFNWRIVGGSDAGPNQFPYIVSLRVYAGHNCGGSIINDKWILTAGHCVDGWIPSDYIAVAGTTTLDQGGQVRNVSKIILHEQYDEWNIRNDIALIKVNEPFEFNESVQPIALATKEVGAGSDAVLTGWGRISYPGDIPNNLQWINLKTVSLSQCQNAHWSPVYDSQICTLTRSGEGACHGDSGGPLTADGVQIGVVSWGRPCALGSPDVFTKVSAFQDWIQINLEN